MNRYAEMQYGKVLSIIETTNDMTWIRNTFSPNSQFIDVTGIHDENGDDIVRGCVYEDNTWKAPAVKLPETLDDHKKLATDRCKQLVDQKIAEGFYSKALESELFFPSNKEAQETMEDLIELTEAGEDVELWITAKPTKTSSDDELDIYYPTIDELTAIYTDFKTHRAKCRKRGIEINKNIKASTTVDEVYRVLNWEK